MLSSSCTEQVVGQLVLSIFSQLLVFSFSIFPREAQSPISLTLYASSQLSMDRIAELLNILVRVGAVADIKNLTQLTIQKSDVPPSALEPKLLELSVRARLANLQYSQGELGEVSACLVVY